jgi:Cu+-exporting ATPase
MAIMVGTGEGARSGVLIKTPRRSSSAGDTLVIDKTGTLTEGRPKVTSIEPTSGLTEDELLTLAAAIERGSEHPLAGAIVSAAEQRGIRIPQATAFASETGKGVGGLVAGRQVDLGSVELMKARGIDSESITEISDRADSLRRDENRAHRRRQRSTGWSHAVADPIRVTTPTPCVG